MIDRARLGRARCLPRAGAARGNLLLLRTHAPKSTIFTESRFPLSLSMRFSGFRSLCTHSREWRYASPEMTCAKGALVSRRRAREWRGAVTCRNHAVEATHDTRAGVGFFRTLRDTMRASSSVNVSRSLRGAHRGVRGTGESLAPRREPWRTPHAGRVTSLVAPGDCSISMNLGRT